MDYRDYAMSYNRKSIQAIKLENISYMDDLLLDRAGMYKVVPAAVLKELPVNHLQQWGSENAIFQYITTELIEWLRKQIGDRKAVEICAGNGLISRTLGIIGIDSRIQQSKKFNQAVEDTYGNIRPEWVRTSPPKDIKKYEAMEAVRVFRPEVVVGAFVTPKGTPADAARGVNCNAWGPNEGEILDRVKKYIHFGNLNTHTKKFIYARPHQELYPPWLVTRCNDQSLNRIWIWENN